MSAPRSLSISGCRGRRLRKEIEPSGSAKKSRHALYVVLGLSSPNAASSSSTPSHRPQQVPHVPTPASSLGENDFMAMTDEQMWGYQSHCLSVAMSHEICEKKTTFELSEKRIKEYETELEEQRGKLSRLRWPDNSNTVASKGMHPNDHPLMDYLPHRRTSPAAFHGSTSAPFGSVRTNVLGTTANVGGIGLSASNLDIFFYVV
ncbi:unnamed protein product [Prunus armeniaca]